MLTLAPKRYTAGFCMVAKVILWCILPQNALRRDCNSKCIEIIEGHYLEVVLLLYLNHCIVDSIDLHNARAVNFLRKPSKNMSKYYFSKYYIFLSKKFRIEKY